MDEIKSREDYLEAILMLEEKKGNVRSVDVASELGFTKPSVSIALKKLKEKGLVVIEDGVFLKLTDEGREIAKKTLDKHEFFTNLFIKIGVDPKTAETEACSLEHSISEETFYKIKKYVKSLNI